jgi:hypothetical protein
MITMSLQTKLGEKVSLLVDRVSELWNGKSDNKKKNGKNGNGTVKVSQPISGQQSSSGYTDGTAINSLPTFDVTQGSQNTIQPQQLPNYDAMYKQENTPLVGAASPGMSDGMTGVMEPMAANSVLGGGSSWGSW